MSQDPYAQQRAMAAASQEAQDRADKAALHAKVDKLTEMVQQLLDAKKTKKE